MKANSNLKYFVIAILVFIVFNALITKTITLILVEPLFSTIEKSVFNDIIVWLIVLYACYKVFNKTRNYANIPTVLIYFSAFYAIAYIYYRLNDTFYFVPSWLFNGLKVLDFLILIPSFLILLKIGEFLFFKNPDDNGVCSEDNDEPTVITEKNDVLNRLKIVKSIEEKITNTNSPKESYPIGIVAEWGNGKTTILHTLIKHFEEKPEYTTIEFNPWKCSSSEKIIETFFKLLKEKLSPYSFIINNKIEEYVVNLTTLSKNSILSSTSELVEKFTSEPNIEDQYDKIKKEIIAINRKIIITIDDLDRLNKKEIYEVIRLIRNTANFPNVFFVVAYDKEYVLKAIEEINTHNSHFFLEKIFQIEETLTPIKTMTLEGELIKRMHSILKGKSKEGFDNFIEQSRIIRKMGSLHNRKIPFIENLRDVKRFVNSFEMRYKIIGDEVFIPDLLWLELLRFKVPSFYNYFQYNYTDIVEESKLVWTGGDTSPNLIVLIGFKEGKTKLDEHLKNENYPKKEFIKEIMTYLFMDKPKSSRFDKEKINEHLSISFPTKFNRYFDWDLNDDLSDVLFDKVREKSTEEFKQWISEIYLQKNRIKNLRERFQNIQFFESEEDFKKVINVIFHFANLINLYPNGTYQREYLGYDYIFILRLFNSNNVIKNIYENDEVKLKAFLTTFLQTDSSKYCYNNDFVNNLYEKGYDWISNLFENRSELLDIVFSNFKNAIRKSSKLSMSLIWHYNNCKSRGLIEHGDGVYSNAIPRGIEEPANKLLKSFVIENDIDGFIRSCVDKKQNNNYQLDTKFLFDVMGGRDVAEEFFANFETKSKYKEEFSKLIKDTFTVGKYREEGFPRDYFKVIPVDLPFYEN
jgi:ABC-type dipeptide/oligopeptide/nickel transport system ATPase subunit